jgi:hypothetical protein
MNYNNFACRISPPRLAAASSKKSAQTASRKSRKVTRRRLESAVAALLFALATAGAETRTQAAGMQEKPIVDSTNGVLAAQIGVTHASAVTIILLCGGLGVALFQARLLLRRDLSC